MAVDWSAYSNAWNNYNKPKEEKKVVADKVDAVPQAVIEHNYEEYVEKHIIDEPEQVVTSNTDFEDMAKVSAETFESVLGELPDADPTPKPELDAEYTAEEKEALKEKVTETKVKAVKVSKTATTEKKKKAGRPKKNA